MLNKAGTKIMQVKFALGGGIEINYATEVQISSDEKMEVKRSFSTPEEVDFDEITNELKPHVARDNYLSGIGVQGKDIDELEVEERIFLDALYQKMHIDKIVIGGKKHNIIKIFARIEGMYDTPKLYMAGPFNLSKYPYAEDLENTYHKLKDSLIDFLNETEFKIKEN